MQTLRKTRIFRIFSANDWNQPELIAFKIHSSIQSSKSRQLFPQMRKNCVNSNLLRSKEN